MEARSFRTTTWFMPRASAMAVAETYLEASSERVLKKLRYVGSRCKVCFDYTSARHVLFPPLLT